MDSPIGEAKASRWDSSCTITAVDDKDKTMPSTSEACQVLPKAMARAQMMAEDITTCSAPAPNTHRRIAHRRSAELQPDHEHQEQHAQIGQGRQALTSREGELCRARARCRSGQPKVLVHLYQKGMD